MTSVDALIEERKRLETLLAELPSKITQIQERINELAVVPLRELTRRQEEVLALVRKGHSNKEIAAQLNLSERCIKFHVSSVLARFGKRSRHDL